MLQTQWFSVLDFAGSDFPAIFFSLFPEKKGNSPIRDNQQKKYNQTNRTSKPQDDSCPVDKNKVTSSTCWIYLPYNDVQNNNQNNK